MISALRPRKIHSMVTAGTAHNNTQRITKQRHHRRPERAVVYVRPPPCTFILSSTISRGFAFTRQQNRAIGNNPTRAQALKIRAYVLTCSYNDLRGVCVVSLCRTGIRTIVASVLLCVRLINSKP